MSALEYLAGEESGDSALRRAPANAAILPFPNSALRESVRFVDASSLSSADRALKRAFDLAIASAVFALAVPVMATVALLVRLDSKGPVLFRQERVGLDGRLFSIVKFRTMHVLEDGNDVVQAARNDARVTRIGGWLRRTSLDELPQLFNVFRGDMSVIGPRPHAVLHDRHYAALIEDYVLRQRVKPGITGWAQVNGFRGATPTIDLMRARIRHDVWYTRHASLALDLRILLRTPLAMFSQRNAY